MTSKTNKADCSINCWGIAALVGFLAMVLLYWMADFGLIQAIFAGGLAAVVLGLVLIWSVCNEAASNTHDQVNAAKTGSATTGAPTGTSSVAVSAGSATTSSGTMSDANPAASAAVMDATSVGGPEAGTVPAGSSDITAPAGATAAVDTTLGSPKSKPKVAKKTTAPKAKAAAAPKAKAAVAPKPKAAPKAKVAAAPKAKAAAPKAKAAAASKAAAPAVAVDGKPATMLNAARAEGADDLKLIGGVGPKLEQTLNDLGVYHFDQVAKWKKKDIAWVDERLRFKGRIERDDWMSQAKILAKGGETEFSRKKSKT